MRKQRSPRRVACSRPSCVARCSEAPSRITHSSPTISQDSVSFALSFRCCGSSPTYAAGPIRHRAPIALGPRKTEWASITQPAPTRTRPSMTTYGPTFTPSPNSARRSMIAVGWMLVIRCDPHLHDLYTDDATESRPLSFLVQLLRFDAD